MNAVYKLQKNRVLFLISALVLMLALLPSLVAPVLAMMATEGAASSPNLAEALPNWWEGAPSHRAASPGASPALPDWWRPGRALAAPRVRPLQQQVAYIKIVDAADDVGNKVITHTMIAGETFQVWAAGYDASDNFVEDVQATWTGTGVVAGHLSPTVGISITFAATEVGTGAIRASTATTATDDGTETITVDPGPLDHIVVRNAADGGGIEVGAITLTIYATQTVYAAGYDANDNFIEDLSVDWGLTDGLAAGDIEPSSGISSTFTPPASSVNGAIVATYTTSVLTDSTGHITVQAPQLTISKSGNKDPVIPGQTLGYTIDYTNGGNATAPEVYITETYDPNVSFVLADVPPSAGDNYWLLEALPPGESGSLFVVVEVTRSLESGTVLTNLVTVAGPRLAQHTFAETTAVTSTPDLTLTITASRDPVDAGDDLNYQIQYENTGDAPVHNVVITMVHDSHLTFVSASETPQTGGDNVWVWDEGTLPGGKGGGISVWVAVDEYLEDQYTLITSATIMSTQVGPYTAFEYTVVQAPALAVKKTATPSPAIVFDRLVYTLVYSNVGHLAASGLVITDAVPANTSYFSCQPVGCSHSGGIVTWQAADLAVGAKRSATMVVDVDRNLDSGTVLTNIARVRVLGTPAYSATAQITTTVVSSPSLWFTIDNGTTFVHAGDDLEYTLDYFNTGTGRAYSTTIVVTPPSFEYVENVDCVPSSDCVSSGGKLIYDIGTLDGGEDGTVRMAASVKDSLPAGARSIVASAVISTVTPGDPPEDNYDEDVDEIATRPDLVVTADYEDIMPWPGKRVTYTVEYKNKGHIATTGVAITVAKSPHATYEAGASDSCWVPQGGGEYSCELGDLDDNESGERLFVVTLTTAQFASGITDFDATLVIDDDGLSGEDADPNDNTFEAPLGVPNLVIEDAIPEPSIWRGEPGLLNVIVKNIGEGTACGVYNPNGCTSFSLDLFKNPVTPPASDRLEGFGDCYVYVGPLASGAVKTATISFTLDLGLQYLPGFCRASALTEIWLKVDNWDPDADPYPEDFGLVPESKEDDNVDGPVVPGYDVFLPLILQSD